MELFKPSVPSFESYIDDLKIMDQNGWYSNFGPFYNQFREGLASHFKCQSTNIELFCNGTIALIAGLAALKKEDKPYCILPSWTFVASAHAVISAGLIPYFIDVDFESMQISGDELNHVPETILTKTSAILVVAPFGAPIRDIGLSYFSQKHGIDILVDAAAGFESYTYSSFNTMISLHATKTFGIGEGGLLISSDAKFIERAHQFSNFGFSYGDRTSNTIGTNGKLNEISSVVGIAALRNWPILRQQYYDKAKFYIEAKKNETFEFMEGWGRDWVSSTCVVRFETKKHKEETVEKLKEKNVPCRDWWNKGCHLEAAFKLQSHVKNMKNTNDLANRTLGIIFHLAIRECDIKLYL
jgi:dTDP-4-amino-4,6-dideoxygalactose transaminase